MHKFIEAGIKPARPAVEAESGRTTSRLPAKHKAALAGLLLLPLAVPLLIFGAAASSGESHSALLLEAAVSLLLTAAGPFAAGAAFRASRT